MASLIYALCTLTSLACAWMLLASYRRTRHRLLLWSGWCFLGLTVNNMLLMADKVLFTNVDLSTPRLLAALVSLGLLLYGLIYEKE